MTERKTKTSLALRIGLWVLFVALICALVTWLIPAGSISRLV